MKKICCLILSIILIMSGFSEASVNSASSVATVYYNANGGYGAPSSQSTSNGKIRISNEEPERYGYKFEGWAFSPTASTYQCKPGDSLIAVYETVTLYAVWAKEYTVHYNANGGIGAPDSQTSTYGSAIIISRTRPTRDGYRFKGWTTSAMSDTVGYDPGESYSRYETITLYAVWEEIKTYTITYMANGGQYAPNEQMKGHGESIYLSSDIPTRDGYVFKGWGTNPSSSEVLYSKGSLYTDNASITLYAIWQKKETPTDIPIVPTETPTDTPTTIKPTTSPSDKPNKEYAIGDVNNDGTVNLNDALMTLKAALGIIQLDEYSKKAADVDGKEGVTLSDAQLCLKYALGIISVPQETEKPIGTEKPQETEKPIESEIPSEEKRVLVARNTYGVGEEHTEIVNRITFHWYDRYERGYGDSYFEIKSFDIEYVEDYYEWTQGYDGASYTRGYYIVFDVETNESAPFWWIEYDEDMYFVEDKTTRFMQGLKGYASAKGKAKGIGVIDWSELNGVSYVEFSPWSSL